MKTFVAIGIYAIAYVHSSAQDDDPFADKPQPDPPRPERKIEKLPSSISYKKIKNGSHSYTITGIYDASKEDDDSASTYEVFIPDCTSLSLDFKNHTSTFITSRKLTLSELAYALDDLARLGGDFPYWKELEARDIKASEAYNPRLYIVDKLDGKFPHGLAWFMLPRYDELRTPFSWTEYNQGTLFIVSSTAHCMAHSRYTIRVLDGDDKLVWQDSSTALADVRIAIADVNQDGVHEIYLDRDDHGKKTRFQIKQLSEQVAAPDG